MKPEILGTVVETSQGIFCVDPDDQFVTRALVEHGAFGLDEIGRILQFVGPSSKILLVGTHVGSLLIPLSRSVESIVGIEANPETYKRMRLNVLMNRCHNVRTFNIAASDAAGSIEFIMNRTNSGASKRMPIIKNPIYFEKDARVTSVPTVRLDDLLPHEYFDLVFMDIEGSETFAMRGMPRILSRAKAVFAEFYPFMVREVAGVDLDAFLAPLAEFNTLIVPSLSKSVHKEDFRSVLQDMFDKNQCDAGIVFIRDRAQVAFAKK